LKGKFISCDSPVSPCRLNAMNRANEWPIECVAAQCVSLTTIVATIALLPSHPTARVDWGMVGGINELSCPNDALVHEASRKNAQDSVGVRSGFFPCNLSAP